MALTARNFGWTGIFFGRNLQRMIVGVFMLIMCFAWLCIGLFLTFAGLKHRSRGLTILGTVLLLFFVFSFVDPIRRIQNINRKDVFAQIYHGAPECRIHIQLYNKQEMESFTDTVRQFATLNDIQECRNILYMGYSGPPRCTFKGEHVAIWSSAASIMATRTNTAMVGNFQMSPFDEHYPVEEFKRLSESIINMLRVKFAERVEVSLKELEKK